MLRIAISSAEGRLWQKGKLSHFAKGSPIRRAGERKFDGEVLFYLQNKNRQHRGKEEKAVLPVYENSKHLRLSGGFW